MMLGADLTGRAETSEKPPMRPACERNCWSAWADRGPSPAICGPSSARRSARTAIGIESVTYEAEPGDRDPRLPADSRRRRRQPSGAGRGRLASAQRRLAPGQGRAGRPGRHAHAPHGRGPGQGRLRRALPRCALLSASVRARQLHGRRLERFEFLRYVVAGKCLAWKNILDMRRAIDYLCSRPEVRRTASAATAIRWARRTPGWSGPWEPRLKCLVGNCCLPTYAAIHRTHILHCFPNFIPGWYQYGDTPDIAALIAPRALHLNFGETDSGQPDRRSPRGPPDGSPGRMSRRGPPTVSQLLSRKGSGHVLSPEMWRRAELLPEIPEG